MPVPSFQGLRVLSLESRRATEMAALITTFGGVPLSAPALREVPLESNTEAARFAERLIAAEYDVLVALTGVGLRALLAVVETVGDREAFVAALSRTRIAARGPKPVSVLRELRITPWVVAPEPNTWRELLAAIDAAGVETVRGTRVAVQEYGRSNPELLEGLQNRGAVVTPVPVYQYALPEDVGPLRTAVEQTIGGHVDVALFTTATQATHLFQVAEGMGKAEALRAALDRVVLASIGPSTDEGLRDHGLTADLDASHPRMGILVREAAEQSGAVLTVKRQSDGS